MTNNNINNDTNNNVNNDTNNNVNNDTNNNVNNDDLNDLFFKNVDTESTPDSDSDLVSNNSSIKIKAPKNHKQIKLAPVIGAVAAIAAVIAVVFVLNRNFNNSNSDSSFNDDSSVLTKDFQFDDPISDYLGMEDIIKMLMTSSSQLSGNATLTSLTDSPSASGTSLDYVIKKDMENNMASMMYSLKYRGLSALSATYYEDEDSVKIKIPTLNEGVFTYSSKDIEEQYKNSALYKLLGDNASFSSTGLISNYSDYFALMDKCSLELLIEAFKETYPDDYKTILENISVKKINNKDNQTQVTISSKSIKLIVGKLLTLMVDNDTIYEKLIKPQIETQLAANTLLTQSDNSKDNSGNSEDNNDNSEDNSGNSEDNSDNSEDNNDNSEDNGEISEASIKSELKDQLSLMAIAFSTMYNGDITYEVSKDNAGRVVSLTSHNEVTFENDDPLIIDFNIKGNGTENPTDNMTFTLKLTYGGETYTIEYNHNNVLSGSSIVSSEKITFYYFDSEASVNLIRSYDTSSKAYNFILMSNIEDESFSINATGMIRDVIKGASFNLDINNIIVTIDNKDYCMLSGNAAVSKLGSSITAPSGTEYKIFEMTESELQQLQKSMESGMNSLNSTINSIIGK